MRTGVLNVSLNPMQLNACEQDQFSAMQMTGRGIDLSLGGYMDSMRKLFAHPPFRFPGQIAPEAISVNEGMTTSVGSLRQSIKMNSDRSMAIAGMANGLSPSESIQTKKVSTGSSKTAQRIVVLHPFPTSWEFILDAHASGFEVWATRADGIRLPNRVKSKICRTLKSSLYKPEAIAEELGYDSNVVFFYPGSEMAVLAAAELSREFGLPGNSSAVAFNSRYKDAMREALNKIVPQHNPRFAVIRDGSDLKTAADEIGFPAVFKRTDFAGSLGVKRVNNVKELTSFFDEQVSLSELPFGQPIRPIYLLEEYITGPEFSVEAVTI